MSVDQMSVDQMSVDQMSVDQMSVDQLSLNRRMPLHSYTVIILNDVVLPAPLTPSSLKHYANAHFSQRYANAQLADCHEVTVELILLAHDERVGLNETVNRCVVDNTVSLTA